MTRKAVVWGLLAVSFVAAGAGCKKKDAAGADSTGVAECDEYVTKYEACMSKMPVAAKAQMEQAFKAQRDGFRQTAATPEGKTALKTSCKQLVDALASNPTCK